jgi:hypothetical protein
MRREFEAVNNEEFLIDLKWDVLLGEGDCFVLYIV